MPNSKILILLSVIFLTFACSSGSRLTEASKTSLLSTIDSLRSEGNISGAIDSLNNVIDRQPW